MKRRSFIREIVFLSAAPLLWLPRRSAGQPGWSPAELAALARRAGGGTPFTFGNTTIAGLTSTSTRVQASLWPCSNTGTISSISFYGKFASGSGNAAAAIYNDSAGSVGSLLAQSTGTVAMDSTAQWRSVSLSASVSSGTSYWLAVWADASMTYYYDSDAAYSIKMGQSTVFHEFNPFSLNSTSASRKQSIYASGT